MQSQQQIPEAPQKVFQGYENLGFVALNCKKNLYSLNYIVAWTRSKLLEKRFTKIF